MTIQTLDMDYFKGIAARVKAQKEAPKVEIKPVVTPAKEESRIIPKINLQDYVPLGIIGLNGKQVGISMTEIEGSNNKNYEDTHKFLLEQGLYMPTPQIFMHFFKEVLKSKKGNNALYDSNNSELSKVQVNEIYNHLTQPYKNKFGNTDMGAWTWLNAKFIGGFGCMSLDLETVMGLNNDGTLKTVDLKLDECMDRDTYVELDFSSQGFPKYSSSEYKYKPGKNIYFYGPRKDGVVKFGASLSQASLDCDRNSADTLTSLGSFACFEGAFK